MTKKKTNDIHNSYRYKQCLAIIDKLESGIDVPCIEISKATDYIAWMCKFHKVPIEELHELADRVSNALEERNSYGY